jgi:hypothetical protein
VGIRTKTQGLQTQQLKIQAAGRRNNMTNLFSLSDRRVQGVLAAIVIGAVVLGWQTLAGDTTEVTGTTTAATVATGDTTTNVTNTPSTAVAPNTTTEGTMATEEGEVGAATGASTTGTTTE